MASSLTRSFCVSPILAGKGYSLTYGAPNLFKQFPNPPAEPHILKFASRNLTIYPGFVPRCANVACSPTWQQWRQFHGAALRNIDDSLFQKTCLSVVPVESPSIPIVHPHQESGARQGITGDPSRSRKT